MTEIALETPADSPAVERLLDHAFGPDRQHKTAYRYREGVPPVSGLCFVARRDGGIVGSVRHWPTALDTGATTPLLLGPIAVAESDRRSGIGEQLMRHALLAAKHAGYSLVVLVGDAGYYGRFGFFPAGDIGVTMPGEDPERLLARFLGPAPACFPGGTLLPARQAAAAMG